MTRKRVLWVLGLISLLAILGVGALTFFSVHAQSEDDTTAGGNPPPFRGRYGKGLSLGSDGEALAQALGISLEELQAAQQEALAAALEQAVEEGLLTQKQAEWLQSQGRPLERRWSIWLHQNGIDLEVLLAKALGISVEKLNEAKQKAREIAIDRAVSAGKLTQEQAERMKAYLALLNNENFLAAMRAAFEAAVKRAVQEGVITQAQAELLLRQPPLWLRWQGMPGFLAPFGLYWDEPPPHGGLDRMPFPLP
ncbi:MAG: zinc ribbon-containing protein [Anaerolineales bacterium]|nr:zinc ribbon-containing protein [Anaerolineales bacterium]MDW8162658.1 hypothetical protein [Anaerolineales bacterium]